MSCSLVLDLWEFYLPYLYSCISLMGGLLLLSKFTGNNAVSGLSAKSLPHLAPVTSGAEQCVDICEEHLSNV